MRLLLLLFTAAFALTGCSQDYMAEREFYKANKLLMTIKKSEGVEALDPAIKAFQRVIDKYPSSPKALESLQIVANMYLKQKKYDEARASLNDIIQNFGAASKHAVDARYTIAKIFQQEGKWTEAEEAYWSIAEFHPLHVKGLYAPIQIMTHYRMTGNETEFKRKYVKALDHYEKLAKEVGPIEEAAAIKNYKAMALMIGDEWQKAIKEWASIHEEFPGSPYGPMGLLAAAELSWKKQNFADAYAYYEKYFEKHPNHPLAAKTALGVGLLHYGNEEFAEARKWFERALNDYYTDNTEQQASVKLLIGKTWQAQGNWDAANGVYTEIEEEFVHSGPALQIPLLRANYYKEIGDTEKAESLFDDAIGFYERMELEEGPDQDLGMFARRFKASALAQKGDWDTLIRNVDEYRAQETDPERQGRWLFLKALLTQNRLGDPEKAASLYQDFLNEYPNHVMVGRAKAQMQEIKTAAAAEREKAQATAAENELPETTPEAAASPE